MYTDQIRQIKATSCANKCVRQNDNMNTQERYIGFYTLNLFWTIERPDIATLKNDPKKFEEEFSRVIISYSDENFKIEICRDGLILMHINRLEQERILVESEDKRSQSDTRVTDFNSEYIAYLNAFQLLLTSATLQVQKYNYFDNVSLSSYDVISTTKKDGKFDGASLPSFDITQSYYLGRYLSQYNPNYPVEIDQRIAHRHTIIKEVFDKSIVDFKKIFTDIDTVYILSQINSALSEFKKLSFRQSLILSWFSIEYFINKHWINFLQEKKEAKETQIINSTRREFLTGKDITSSIMSNMLELNGKIPNDIFVKIDNVRGKRNLIIHNLDRVKKLADVLKESPQKKENKSIHFVDCYDAFDVLKYFVLQDYKIELSINAGFSCSVL